MKVLVFAFVSAVTLATTSGCGQASGSASSVARTSIDVDGSRFRLSEEPDGAVGVIDARESAEDGAPLVLVGRIGGVGNPWIEGRAAFTLLDASMSVVADGEASGEGELCAADCCATERLSCTTNVKVVDDEGRLIGVDSRELLGVRQADMVVVRGHAKKDKDGNFVMLASGVYVRE